MYTYAVAIKANSKLKSVSSSLVLENSLRTLAALKMQDKEVLNILLVSTHLYYSFVLNTSHRTLVQLKTHEISPQIFLFQPDL